MKKIKIFESMYEDRLEKRINEFSREHNIIDIQYRMTSASNCVHHSVMIVYEDMKRNEE